MYYLEVQVVSSVLVFVKFVSPCIALSADNIPLIDCIANIDGDSLKMSIQRVDMLIACIWTRPHLISPRRMVNNNDETVCLMNDACICA